MSASALILLMSCSAEQVDDLANAKSSVVEIERPIEGLPSSNVIILQIVEDGTLVVDGNSYTLETIEPIIREAKASDPPVEIVVRAATGSDTAMLTDLLQLVSKHSQ